MAALKGQLSCIEVLVANRADVNAQDKCVRHCFFFMMVMMTILKMMTKTIMCMIIMMLVFGGVALPSMGRQFMCVRWSEERVFMYVVAE